MTLKPEVHLLLDQIRWSLEQGDEVRASHLWRELMLMLGGNPPPTPFQSEISSVMYTIAMLLTQGVTHGS